MSKLYYTNISLPSITAGKLGWEIASRMVAQQGFTQAGSGDGTTYSNAGAGPVAAGTTGAGGLDNDEAWVRLAKTISGVLYETVFVREGGSPGSVRIYQSIGAAFTGGSPGASARPTSTAEQALFTSAWVSGNNAYAQIVLESSAPYGIFAHAYDAGTRLHSGWFGMIPLTTVGTAPGAPYVFGGGNQYDVSALCAEGGAGWWHYRRYGLSGAGWVSAPMCKIQNGSSTLYPFGAGNKAEESSKTTTRAIVHAGVGNSDLGENAWLEWPSTDNGNGNLYSVGTTGDRVQVGALVLKYWNNTVPT